MATYRDLGVIERIDLRNVWKNEPREFTPWLEDEISRLGEVLKIDDLRVKAREAPVGSPSSLKVDLLATYGENDKLVVIENQLGDSDHEHLGKILSYAAGCDAELIVWIAKTFTDYHRQALDWLNQHSDGITKYFGVQIEVLKIDNSRPAADFNLIVMPNEWERDIKRNLRKMGEKDVLYRAFFRALLYELGEIKLFMNREPRSPYFRQYFPSAHGGRFRYSVGFRTDKTVSVEVRIDTGKDQLFNKKVYDEMFQRKNAFENQLQESLLQWERLDDKKMSRISLFREGTIEDEESKLEEIRRWMLEKLVAFTDTFNKDLEQFELDDVQTADRNIEASR